MSVRPICPYDYPIPPMKYALHLLLAQAAASPTPAKVDGTLLLGYTAEDIAKLASGGASVICVLGVLASFYLIKNLKRDGHPQQPALIQKFMWFSGFMAVISGLATFYLGYNNATKVASANTQASDARQQVAQVRQEAAQASREIEEHLQKIAIAHPASSNPPGSGRSPASVPPPDISKHLEGASKAILTLKRLGGK